MKHSFFCVMVASALLSACGDSSSDDGTGGTSSTGGFAGEPSSTGGTEGSETGGTGGGQASGTGGSVVGTGGAAGSPGSASGGGSAGAVGGSGLDGASIVTQLSATDLDTLCRWIETTIGLVRGATPDAAYTGTWMVSDCPSGEAAHLWGSPEQCALGIAAGNAIGCETFTLSSFESCITAVKDDLCLLEGAPECVELNGCFPQVVED